MGEVIDLNPSANPDVVLREAVGAFSSVLILGYDNNGYMEVRASYSLVPKSKLLLLIESFKHNLMNGVYDAD